MCRFKDQSCVCTVGHPSSRPTAPQRSRPEFTLVTADLDPCRRSPVTGGHKRRNAGVHTFASHQALHSISPSLSFCFCEMGIINAALPNLCVWERSEQDLHKPQGALSIPGRLTWGRGHAGAGGLGSGRGLSSPSSHLSAPIHAAPRAQDWLTGAPHLNPSLWGGGSARGAVLRCIWPPPDSCVELVEKHELQSQA